jgi:ATP-dependent Clp protease adapter protein ClpS
MHDVFKDAEPVRLVFHNDETPMAFVTELLRTVFGKPERDATAFASLIDAQGKAACGPYPQAVADALFEAAQRQIAAAGHCLLITRDTAEAGPSACDLCGTPVPKTEVLLRGKTACGTCVLAVMRASEGRGCCSRRWS